MEARGLVPPGFGLWDDEWGDYAYPSAEAIQVARKEAIIPLSLKIWYPRAVRWVCALIALTLTPRCLLQIPSSLMKRDPTGE
jgi:hypothetical protein